MKLSQLLLNKNSKNLSKTPKIQAQKRPVTSYDPNDFRPTSSRVNLAQKFNHPLPPISKARKISKSRLKQHVISQKKHIQTGSDLVASVTTSSIGKSSKFIRHSSGGADKLRIPIPPQRKNSTQASQHFWEKASHQFQNAEMYKNYFIQQFKEERMGAELAQDQYFRDSGAHPSVYNKHSNFSIHGDSGMQQKDFVPAHMSSFASFAQRYHERKRSQGIDISLKQSKNNFQSNDRISSISNNNRSSQVVSFGNNNNNNFTQQPIQTKQSQNQMFTTAAEPVMAPPEIETWASRPFHFLSSVGGKQTSSQAVITPQNYITSKSVSNQVTPRYYQKSSNSSSQKQNKMYFDPTSKTVTALIRQKNDNVRQFTIFTGADVDIRAQFDKAKPKDGSMSSRPTTTSRAGAKVINSKDKRQQQQYRNFSKNYNTINARPSSAQSTHYRKVIGPSGSSVQVDVLKQNMRRLKMMQDQQQDKQFQGNQDYWRDFDDDTQFDYNGVTYDERMNFPPQQRPPNLDYQKFSRERPKSASSNYLVRGKLKQADVVKEQSGQSKTAGNVKIPEFLHLIEHVDLNSTSQNAHSQSSLPFPQLLDRSERTLAATFAKFKDLTYYTPVQRIGAYYDFTSRLKRKHLIDIIAYLKTAQATGTYRQQSTPQQFTENSLFLGIMQLQTFEENKNSNQKANNLLGQQIQPQNTQAFGSESVQEYDPVNSGYWDKKPDFSKIWSQPLVKRLQVSIIRYLQYLYSDAIEESEISKYRKQWMTNALNQVPDNLLQRQYLRELFTEIFRDYSLSQRMAILNYILLSPFQRQRLHILVLPIEFSLTSYERVSLYGGYNLTKHYEWHKRKLEAESNIKIKLLTNNIAMSSLTQWFYQFRDLRLLQLHGTRKFAKQGGSYSLSVCDFVNLQLAYREKVISFMRDIWLRGAALITKRFKFLKKKGLRNGKWDFTGFREMSLDDFEAQRSFEKRCNQLKISVLGSNNQSVDNKKGYHVSSPLEHSQISLIQMENQNNQVQNADSGVMFIKQEHQSDAKYGFQDHLNDYYQSVQDPNELQDIRQNSAYISFVAMIGGYIDFNQDGYSILAKEYKREIVYCASNLMRLQLRQIVDKSLDIVQQFFLSFSTLSHLINISPHLNKTVYSQSYGAISYCDDFIDENDKQKQKEAEPIIYGGAPIPGVHHKDSLTSEQIQRKRQIQREQKKYVHLEFPPFSNYQHLVNPIFRIDLVVGADANHPAIEFQQSLQQVSSLIEKWINGMIISFNKFPRMEFCQLEFVKREQIDREQDQERKQERLFGKAKKFSNDFDQVVFQDGDPRANQKFFEICRLNFKQFQSEQNQNRNFKEKQQKLNMQRSATKFMTIQENRSSTSPFNRSPSYSQNQIKSLLRVAKTQEKRYLKIKQTALETLQIHYNQSTAVYDFFQQFRQIFSGQLQSEYDSMLVELSLQDNLKKFLTPAKKVKYKLYRNAQILGKCRRYADMVQLIPNNFFFPMFEVNCIQVKSKLTQIVRGIISTLLIHLQTQMNEDARSICNKFQDIINVVKKEITTASEVMEMQKFKGNLIQASIQLNDQIQLVRMYLFFLIQNDHILSDYALSLATKLYHWPSALSDASLQSDQRHRQQRSLVERDLRNRRIKFQQDIKEMRLQVKDIQNVCEITHYRKWIQKVIEWQQQLEKLEETANQIGEQENMLFAFKSTIDAFEDLNSFYSPYAELWLNINEFLTKKKEWTSSLINTINPQEVNEQIKLKIRVLAKLSKLFHPRKDLSATRVLAQFKTEVSDLNNWLPKIQILCNENLKERHWRKIQTLIGANFNWKNITLTQASYLKFDSKLQQLADISDEACKQLAIQNILDKMEKEWQNLRFVVTNFRDTGIPILHGSSVQDIQLLLDDHLLKAQNMRGSLYIKPFEDRVIAWDKSLLHINQMIENWVEVQAQYLYLEPIFNSQDMKRQMPGEATQFLRIDEMWRDIMGAMMSDTLVLHVEKIPNANERLRRANVSLQHIQRSLNDYLEGKRAIFSRFYFLSNDELLQILGERRKPEKVQRYLKKCFQGINELRFCQIQNQNNDITHIISREGQTIQLIHSIDTNMYDGNVQQWLLQLEHQMRGTMKQICQQCNLDIKSSLQMQGKMIMKKFLWLQKWPAQILLAISNVQRTRQIQKALLNQMRQQRQQLQGVYKQSRQKVIHRDNQMTLYHSLNICNNNIQGIVKLVRSSKVNKNLRIILGAMIVQDVHSRDVIELLIEKQVRKITDFEWVSQLRQYYDQSVEKLYIKMVNTSLVYGYEYIGNTSRLVITPLTDRCYRTLMSAIDLNLGGAPQGPAGTGKTQSTKDLAKTVGVSCIIFNCSQGLNAEVMAKFFRGLASSGSWSCFDQFNRIQIEVLSVIAQQILELQVAKSKRLSRFIFEGKQIDLNPSCNVFITMNPGYAGRTQLPDNLKALFRPVAMMVPDYSLIAEISLYSFGFNEARDLARKVVMTFNLCSDQLSRQDHYDYGMRAVKAVLNTAAKLKQKVSNYKKANSFVNEQNIILKAIKDANLPRLLPNDALLFQGILKDLFINSKPHDDKNTALQNCIHKQISRANLQIVDPFVEKCMQLHQTIKYRHGLMIVGASFGGKTQSYRVLNAAINQYVREFKGYFQNQVIQQNTIEQNDDLEQILQSQDQIKRPVPDHSDQQFSPNLMSTSYQTEIPVMSYVINPKAVSMNDLYGSYDSISHDWTDGILVRVFRQCAYKDVGHYRKWLIFDGPVDTQWIENMNTVLDDTKKLCLSNGQTILMHNYMNLIFEVDDLSQASPATISRCGMVCMQPEFIGWWPIYQSWMDKLPYQLNRQILAPRIESQLQVFCPQLIKFIKKRSRKPESVSQIQLVVSLLKIYGAQLRHQSFITLFSDQRVRSDVVHMQMDQYFLYACLWSFGVYMDNAKDQNQIFTRIRQLSIEQHKIQGADLKAAPKRFHIERTAVFPDSNRFTGYDFYIDGTHWRPWSDMLQKMDSIIKMRQDNENFQELQTLPKDMRKQNVKSRIEKLKDAAGTKSNSQGTGTPQPYLPVSVLRQTQDGSSIIVHTIQSLKFSSFINLLLQNGQSPLIIGQSGVGKTSMILKYLESLNNKSYTKNIISFSSATKSSTTQSQIHSKLQRRSRKQYGPSFGKKLLLFVDDVNLPSPDKYGSQPPIQLLRQIIDHGGWFQLQEANKPFKQLVDFLFLSSMGQQGRSQVSQRYLRHFNIACIPQSSMNNLTRIFSKQFQAYFSNNKIDDSDFKRTFQNCGAASIELYFKVCKEFKPTPERFLYMFNMRDLVRAIQGIQLYRPDAVSSSLSSLNESRKNSIRQTRRIVRLWAHQMMRVFYDRLTGQKDKTWLLKQIFTVCRNQIRDDLAVALKQELDAANIADKSQTDLLKDLKFCDFIQFRKGGAGAKGAKNSWKLYEQIHANESALKDKILEFLDEYNSVSKTPMNLVLFDFAIKHLIRITRILSMRSGHGLLVGIGGSGKQSLTKLASYIQQSQLFEIRTKCVSYSFEDWREDMMAVLKQSGLAGKKILLYLRQAHIEGHPSNDINQLLNIGEIPGIFGNEQIYSISEQLRIIAKKQG